MMQMSSEAKQRLILLLYFLRTFEPGHQYDVVVSGEDSGIPLTATLLYDHQSNLFNPLTWRLMTSPRIYIKYIEVESLEHSAR